MAVLEISDAVRAALAGGRPVVALESAIIMHGLPAPDNLNTARAVEAEVAANGATPATIAVINGKIHIGLSDDMLQFIARQDAAMKCAFSDLAPALARGGAASTTVSASIALAHLAGISVFATGGIGGVHRGVTGNWDVSADLWELARRPVCVVCSGAKTILDVAKTLEILESYGVGVVTFGEDFFPGFWAAGRDHPTLRVDDISQITAMLHFRRALKQQAALIVANPVPSMDAIAPEAVEEWIEAALAEAGCNGVSGKQLTPFLLAAINRLSGGASLATNIALVRSNAGLAARIACREAERADADS